METRLETDSMGEMRVPIDALYGATTQRAVLNFPISGDRFSREFISALGLVKLAAAQANAELGLLSPERATLIAEAAAEVVEGAHDHQFPIDIFQTGSGTSTNMNANEVIANRCAQLAGKPVGGRDPVDPNDHVNQCQSSNDVIPTAIHVSVVRQLSGLRGSLQELEASLTSKAAEFWEVLKIGRTHLMDATPVRLGQEFAGFARQCALGLGRIDQAMQALVELPLGGTAVGTGINAHARFAQTAIRTLSERTGYPFREAQDHFEAQGSKDGLVQVGGHLKTIAVSLTKIANDVRWLGSGPQCALAEIQLPSIQPGSSIMPGKVNPVLSESLLQVCARVIGNDATVTWAAAQLSNFELNVGMPVIAHATLESVRLLTNGINAFRTKCVDGIAANRERAAAFIEQSMAMVTSLAPRIGYLAAAEIAKESAKTGRTVREICRAKAILPEDELERLLDPRSMTEPGAPGASVG